MAQSRLEEGGDLAAFLGGLYLVTTPARARPALDDVIRTVEQHAGVAANLGKTRVYRAAGGPPPPGVEELGPDVWCGGDSEPATRGFVALGVPIGHADFIQRKLAARLDDECRLLGELRKLPDLQSAWLLLLYCASPRAQHVLRTVPPRDAAAHASEHDQAVWITVQHTLAELDARRQQWDAARQVASLPAAAGGLGLASAQRLAPAAYWAAWADALPVMLQRRPDAARRCAHELALGGVSAAPCLRAAAAAGDILLAEGWVERPEWDSLLRGAQPAPSPPESSEPGVWPHGWQKPAARELNTSYRERLLCSLPPSSRAPLRSQAGAHAGEWLRAIPTNEGTQLLPLDMQLALRRRLRLPLPLAASCCGGQGKPGCRALVDQFGDHRAACARSGLLARRAPVLERAWVRVAREAVAAEGRVVPQQSLAQTTAPGVAPDDRRRLDLVIYGASGRGEALCCDVTLVSPLTGIVGTRRGCHRRCTAA